jgi:ferredoxin-NADP reductase
MSMGTTIESLGATTVLEAIDTDALTLEVAAKRFIADGVCQLTLRDPRGHRVPDWTPGSHIDLVLPDDRIRQYSLCGDRWDAHTYQIAILRQDTGRGGSVYIHDELRVGNRLRTGGPRNNFAMVPAQRYLFVAGGIGITPLLPMIHQAQVLGVEWSLLYGGRSTRSMAFLSQLSIYGDRVTVWPHDEHGSLDLAAALVAQPAGTKVYCCGPASLLAAVEKLGKDWPTGSIRVERFVPKTLHAPIRDEPFEVHLQRSDVTVTVSPGTSILDAITSSGIVVLSSCRQGTCGTCETRLVSGTPDHRDSLLNDDERARGDSLLVCVSRACSDRLVLDL